MLRNIQYGLGLRPAHYEAILTEKPTVDWFEIISEDFIDLSGHDFGYLEKIRADYPVSMHGVSLSIGSCDPLNQDYLHALRKLMLHIEPVLISDHFCWTGVDGLNTHDLLPLPFTEEAMAHIVQRIQQVQDFLKRRIMLENISSYAAFHYSEMTEWEFISEIAKQADCDILLDINNIYVNAFNHGFSAQSYLHAIPVERVKQFHLAGHKHCQTHIIDTHDAPIAPAVFDLYQKAITLFPAVPVIIERDAEIPALSVMLNELDIIRTASVRIKHFL